MAGEDVGEASDVPGDSLEGWLDAKAEEMDVSRSELLARLRDGDAGAETDEEAFEALRREFGEELSTTREEFESQIADVEADLADAEREFGEKIEDVRERVIQVKREADAKAPADHDHADLRERTEAVAEQADRLGEEVDAFAEEFDALSETVWDLDERVETGFENFEDVLEYLTDATDDLDAKLATLAEVTVELRDQTKALAARHASQAAADELAHLANRRGVERAKCSHCRETVHVGLLAEPKCPHCASTFNDVEPKQGLFGSARLVVGDPPALEGERADWDVGDLAETDPGGASERLDDILGGDDE